MPRSNVKDSLPCEPVCHNEAISSLSRCVPNENVRQRRVAFIAWRTERLGSRPRRVDRNGPVQLPLVYVAVNSLQEGSEYARRGNRAVPEAELNPATVISFARASAEKTALHVRTHRHRAIETHFRFEQTCRKGESRPHRITCMRLGRAKSTFTIGGQQRHITAAYCHADRRSEWIHGTRTRSCAAIGHCG